MQALQNCGNGGHDSEWRGNLAVADLQKQAVERLNVGKSKLPWR
jgi:hypothetical protein